ncbi:MAG: hypothetical protein JKX80_02215 [Candidatus Pacebacteria bacterium]|nr:hypothetical protein [Candidatus Paceibacterota bacterium]
MTRVAKKSIKMFSYLVALSVGVILVFFGIHSKSDSLTAKDAQLNLLGEVVSADNTAQPPVNNNPWSGGDGGGGGDDGGGDDDGGA